MERIFYRKHHILVDIALMSLLAIVLFSAAHSGAVFAVEGQGTSGTEVGFHVSAVIPQNQIDKKQTYFDLSMKPEASQTLRVFVKSDSDAPITVNVDAISASTNRNGVIDYRTPNIRDKTLRIPFSEISTVHEKSLTVPAGGSAAADITVTMPADAYDGVILGGIVFTKTSPSQQAAQTGGSGSASMSIKNEYSYIVGVKLRETETPVPPDFEYDKVEGGLVNHRPAYIHHIRNKEAAIVKDMKLRVRLYKAGESKPFIKYDNTVDMAPNSVMPIGTETGGKKIPAGKYLSRVRLTIGSDVWEFEKGFTVTDEESKNIDDNTISKTGGERTGLSPWLIAAIIIGLCLLLAILLLLLLLWRRRRRKDEEEYEEYEEYTKKP
ncbi:MAG: DUF916 and DUF3324 domain-containing protein [Clostridiales Family XIII bacterium]|jgi:hypothetical protein|nr:DUF916 and DUF3324 domain-containing protein [Clostridiales Family XIII bacterium]